MSTLNNNSLIISGTNRVITRGITTKTISDIDWTTYIAPILDPLWSTDKDRLQTFKYFDNPTESYTCNKSKYVRNHTTGEYFWKDYVFDEPNLSTAKDFVDKIKEAFDAILSVQIDDIDKKFNRIIERESGLSLTRIKAWRDFFLHTSDWTMLEDAPVTAEEKEQWKTWRQKIRELPTQFTNSAINLVQTLKVPIDPEVYKKNYLPYNTGVDYLATDDQTIEFPSGKYSDLERVMEEYVRLALRIRRPSKLFEYPSVSNITDPIDALVKRIEDEQEAVQKLRDMQTE